MKESVTKKPGHLLHQCPLCKRKEGESKPQPSAKKVLAEPTPEGHKSNVPSGSSQEVQEPNLEDTPTTDEDAQFETIIPLSLLFFESGDEGDISTVMVTDRGSRPQLARVDIQGVPADGIVDTAGSVYLLAILISASY